MHIAITTLILFLFSFLATAQDALKTENVFLITLDGLRWQELFSGADEKLITNTKYVQDTTVLKQRFWAASPEERRKKLMPWIWSYVAGHGQIYGNRTLGSKGNLTNQRRFSYPGYNEILCGFADEKIDSNDKIANTNTTVLEFFNRKPAFAGRVAAFCSWDVFPWIINEKRSGVPVNAGFESAEGTDLSAREIFLNELQAQVPSPWATVRLDAFTHHFAVEYIKREHPRLLYIAYGETDDFAHDGNYAAYLTSAFQTDQFIRDLWHLVQNDPVYRNKTSFIITTDHGRGDLDEWTSHGSDIKGAAEVWTIILGPDSLPIGEDNQERQLHSNQVAATVSALLGYEYTSNQPAGERILSEQNHLQ